MGRICDKILEEVASGIDLKDQTGNQKIVVGKRGLMSWYLLNGGDCLP